MLEFVYAEQFDRGELEAALETCLRLIPAYELLYPPNDINTALMWLKAGKTALFLKKLPQASAALKSAKKILAVTHGDDHPLVKKVWFRMSYQTSTELQMEREEGRIAIS